MSENLSEEQLASLDYYASGVPPGPLLKMSFNDIYELVNNAKDHKRTISEISVISLTAYFEAFFKNQFAAIVNICPYTLKEFCAKRTNTSINISDIVTLDFNTTGKLGFILAEQFDFGSPKKINKLFEDLIRVTPFSSKDVDFFNKILEDRNLIVHHCGVYTMRYHKHNFVKQSIGNRIFYDSLAVDIPYFLKYALFVDRIADKLIKSSYDAVLKIIDENKIHLSQSSKGALFFLNWYEKDK